MENLVILESQKLETSTHPTSIESAIIPESTFYDVIKRIVDLFVSVFLFIILIPVLILTALAIKIDSRGPVIFKQKRVGKNQKIFTMYKFRTMVENAEDIYKEVLEKEIIQYKMIRKNAPDPRVTRVGQFLRKFSIDELPQLINVIKGEMSLIGPRPNLPIEFEQLDKEWYKLRYKVLPGISGLWQVSGRSNLAPEKMFELDCEYVMKRSMWRDIKIAFKTVLVVLKCEGAK